ncbi:MAG: methylenetetrahydrofolate reductase C-terminal domain-containing protein [Candidatus Omnitrophica bacterium]|jgi:ferredoxin|nr:methylenetetrahydrofolate reductase C-terminal domain-containing protein [Candidatus Omnitrophota bacterium]
MVVTEKKTIAEIIDSLQGYTKVFIVGCGECSTTCKTGGVEEVVNMRQELEKQGKLVVGSCIPEAPCIAAKLKSEMAKHMAELRQAEACLVLSCGLGVQSVKDNDRFNLAVVPGNDTCFTAAMNAKGEFLEKCSLCAECVLASTGGICPVTLCAKGLLNGPCGGMNKGKCETDPEKDCAWVLIYKQLEKNKTMDNYKKMRPARDYSKSLRPRKKVLV